MYKQLSYNNTQLWYQQFGGGAAAVVLLHGFAEDSRVWQPLAIKLSSHYRVILPDFPGCGRTPFQPDVQMETLAGLVRVILKHEGIAKRVIIGHSMGGYVALAFAERWETQVCGLGLFHSSAFADDAEKKDTRHRGIAFMHAHGAAAFLKSTSPNLFSVTTKTEHPSLLTEQLHAASSFAVETLEAYYNAMMQRSDRTAFLQKTSVPVLLVMGRHDTAIPLPAALAQSHLPQQAYLHLLEQSGHMGMLEEPEESMHLLTQFLAETLPPL